MRFSDRGASLDKAKEGRLSKEVTCIWNLKGEKSKNLRKSLPKRRNSLCKGPGVEELVMCKIKEVEEAGGHLVGAGEEPVFYPKSSRAWGLSRET